jgi:hypothetical protein
MQTDTRSRGHVRDESLADKGKVRVNGPIVRCLFCE